jgi:hypothetical protein
MQSAPIDHTDQDVTAAVLTKAVVRAAGQLDLPTETLASVLGLSEDSISRMRHNGFRLEAGTKPFELGVLFVRFFRSLDAIVEGDEAVARSWLRNPNLAFDGRPLDKITTITGLTDAIAYLDARRASPN